MTQWFRILKVYVITIYRKFILKFTSFGLHPLSCKHMCNDCNSNTIWLKLSIKGNANWPYIQCT